MERSSAGLCIWSAGKEDFRTGITVATNLPDPCRLTKNSWLGGDGGEGGEEWMSGEESKSADSSQSELDLD